jgi:predicted short-subunit dehydrogenase-like oxidoreductase (DUF2520 family)
VSAKRPTVAIVGAGGLARALARGLAGSGRARVALGARRRGAAVLAVRGVRGARAARDLADAVADAEVVILAVPDRALAQVSRSLVPLRPSWRGVVVVHAAGALGTEPLAPLRAAGASIGVLHPLAVAGASGAQALRGAYARIEGTPKARAAARSLCALAGLIPLRGKGLCSRSGRAIYHAGASLAANDVVALLTSALGLFVGLGVPRRDAVAALTVLADGAIAQFRAAGPSGALTGPVARNDRVTLAAQLTALASADPAAAAAHRALSLRLVDLAVASGRLDRSASRGLRTLLTRGRGQRPTI